MKNHDRILEIDKKTAAQQRKKISNSKKYSENIDAFICEKI